MKSKVVGHEVCTFMTSNQVKLAKEVRMCNKWRRGMIRANAAYIFYPISTSTLISSFKGSLLLLSCWIFVRRVKLHNRTKS